MKTHATTRKQMLENYVGKKTTNATTREQMLGIFLDTEKANVSAPHAGLGHHQSDAQRAITDVLTN